MKSRMSKGFCEQPDWLRQAAALVILLGLLGSMAAAQARTQTASIEIDASKVEGVISPLLYGQFAEFMYENIKGGLHAELLRERGFEGAPNALGLPRYWERYPDDRNDDYGLNFRWDALDFYRATAGPSTQSTEHSLALELSDGV